MKESIVISVGGGKGGVGKSSIVANLGAMLATGKNCSVGFIDADLGGANLHSCVGVKRPSSGLQDFLAGRVAALSEIALPTPIPGTWLISGASDICELANPKFTQKQKIINHIRKLAADYILIDLGAGSSANVVDFFTSFSHGVVVCDSMPTSIENAYGFLKNSVMRGLIRLFPGRQDLRDFFIRFSDPRAANSFATVNDLLAAMRNELPAEFAAALEWLKNRRLFLILNMVQDSQDIAVGKRFAAMVKKYLGMTIHYIGYVGASGDMRRSLRALKPAVLDNPSKTTRECFSAISDNLYALTQGSSAWTTANTGA